MGSDKEKDSSSVKMKPTLSTSKLSDPPIYLLARKTFENSTNTNSINLDCSTFGTRVLLRASVKNQLLLFKTYRVRLNKKTFYSTCESLSRRKGVLGGSVCLLSQAILSPLLSGSIAKVIFCITILAR